MSWPSRGGKGSRTAVPTLGLVRGIFGRIWSLGGGGMSLAEETLYGVQRYPRDGLIHRHHANREGSLSPPDVV